MRGRKCSVSFMRRFQALVEKGMTDAELSDWFCFNISEAHMLRKALETQQNVEEIQKEPQKALQISECSPIDVNTAKLDFEKLAPSTFYQISRAPKEKQLDLAVKASHHQWTHDFTKKKVDNLLGKTNGNPDPIDTGVKFHCDICGNDYMIIHCDPDKHRFQKVQIV
jgi:hypothetical protein